MKEKIQNQLKKIEELKKVKILYACETGSRAWGFPSPDSDYDVRMIYMHDVDWYLSLSEKKDTIELMLEDGELDITGWDIRKSFQLLWKSNGALLERVQSPIVYKEINDFASLFYEYAEKCFSPIATIYHYLGLAKNSFADVDEKQEVKLKKLFYSLRATLACKWILDKNTIPPIVFMTMVNELEFDSDLKMKIIDLIQLKSTKDESYIHSIEVELNIFIKNQILISDEAAKKLQGRKEKEVDLDNVFRHIIKTF